MNQPQINIVIPLHNEVLVFDNLVSRLQKLIDSSALSIEVILVDDGSSDNTPLKMKELAYRNNKFRAIILSRNFGHQIALTAGLKYVNSSEAVMIIDGDLQDPPELLDEFYSYLKKGYDVVYAVRKHRKENYFMKLAYRSFYVLLKKISYINIPIDSGDFSLISTRVVRLLNEMPEESRYLRGMRSWVGFSQIGVAYDRDKRGLGESKYTLIKLIKLAYNGIFNFSEFPIKFITNTGFITIITSFIYFIYVLINKIFYGGVPQGFTALLFIIILFGGMQLIAIGLIGEYVIRIFYQVKKRPLYVVKERVEDGKLLNSEEM